MTTHLLWQRPKLETWLREKMISILTNTALFRAIRLFYRQIAIHQEIPFELCIPNQQTAKTLERSERGEDVHRARNAEDLFDKLGI